MLKVRQHVFKKVFSSQEHFFLILVKVRSAYCWARKYWDWDWLERFFWSVCCF